MGGRSGGSFGKSARPAFEGGRGGMGRGYARIREFSRSSIRSLGAAAFRPAQIEEAGKAIDRAIQRIIRRAGA